jgi:hypothetical protein
MELSRRDAMAALAAAGAASVAGGAALTWSSLRDGDGDDETGSFDEGEIRTLVAAAETVYPSGMTGTPSFVERYVVGRVRDRPPYAEGMRDAVATLDIHAESRHDRPFADLTVDDRDAVLRAIGVADASADPDGGDASRLGYYLVNELLFALYSSPTGGELVGIENPQGHPGGIDSYRREPEED